MVTAVMTILFLILAPLRETFIYDTLWWKWVSMLIVHLPLLFMEFIVTIVFTWHYYSRFKRRGRVPMDKDEHLLHVLFILFSVSLAVTHMCTIATASWWFLLPASMPTLCVYVFLMTYGVALLTEYTGT